MSRSVAEEETIIRRINDAIDRGVWPGEDASIVRMRCECGRFECNSFVQIRVADYHRIRSHPRQFVICAGHETPHIEDVTSRHDGYVVVEKRDAAGRLAVESAGEAGGD